MKKRLGRVIVVLLLLSLCLTSHFAEYEKEMNASEIERESEETAKFSEQGTESQKEQQAEEEENTENGSQPKNETVPENESECEKDSESEKEPESERDAESEKEPESEKGSESEKESEGEKDSESEKESESEMDSESERESESEMDSESESESECEIGSETESESETDNRKVVRVSQIKTVLPEEGRIYDGTDQIALSFQTAGLETETDIRVQYEAHLQEPDAGVWPVECAFFLEGDVDNAYVLEIEETELLVEILPKPLNVMLPDGWKSYGKEPVMKQIHLMDEVKVEGFIKDEEGEEIIPEEFEPPEVDVDLSIVEKWSNIYQNGKQKVYKDALIMKKDKKGKILGNATENYVFSEEEEFCQKGKLVIAQTDIFPGADYGVKGEDGAWYTAGDGTLWVRQGTSLQMYPLENRGYNQGMHTGALTQSGSASFSLKKVNKNGDVVADSLERWIPYQVDGMVPEARIEISGVRENQGNYYGNGSVDVQISIPSDDGSGIRQARYFMAVEAAAVPGEMPEPSEWWQDCTEGKQLQLVQQGSYTIYVETEDRTGNKAYAKSAPIVIDTQKPEIRIQGVENNSANRGAVVISLESSDQHYRESSLKVQIAGANGAAAPIQKQHEKTERGEKISFHNFAYQKEQDDIYTLSVSAEDLAGNKTERTITFSINRFGSVYDLTERTRQQLKETYHKTAFPVTFLETNIDYVGSAKLLCKWEGETRELVRGEEYFVTYSGDDRGWKQYQYRIPASVFAREGSYEVMLVSKDKAQNSGDSLQQEKNVEFIIDRTPPECLFTGLSKEGIYEADEMWISIMPRDNIRLKKMQIFLDGKECVAYSGTDVKHRGGVVKWRLDAAQHWQRIQVKLTDEARNQRWTEEIPVFLAGREIEKIPDYVQTEKSAEELEKIPFKLLQILLRNETVVGRKGPEQKEMIELGKKVEAGMMVKQDLEQKTDENMENHVSYESEMQMEERKTDFLMKTVEEHRGLFYLAGYIILTVFFLLSVICRRKRKR